MNLLFLLDPNSTHNIKRNRFFVKKGYNVFYIYNRNPKKITEEKILDGATDLGSIHCFSILNFIKTVKTFLWLRKVITGYEINAFIIFYAEPNSLWSFFRKWLKIPVVIYTAGTDVLLTIPSFKKKRSLFSSIVYYVYKISLRNADYIVSTSKSQVEAVKKITGKSIKYEIIRTGVDFSLLEENSPNSIVLKTEKKKHILFPRLMKPIYRHEFALEAIKILPKKIKNEYGFIFINNAPVDCPYFRKINLIARQIDDAEILFLPKLPQEKIIRLYKMSSLAVMTPCSDGSPVSAMEAMACKTPVILPPLNYDNDVFNNDTVTFFEEWNPESLALCMEKLLQPSAELNKKMNNAYDVVQKHCNYETEMQRLETIIRPLV